MSRPRFPPETLDHIVDHLQDDPGALTQCCLVSKSWVPRTRRHLFAHIKLSSNRLKMWRKAFPDPTNSPAHHTRTMNIDLDGEDAESGSWIRGFSRVEGLSLSATRTVSTSFTPFYNLSTSLKSLCVHSYILHPQVLSLIRSLPLLEDLTLISEGDVVSTDGELDEPQLPVPPPVSPVFTGSLCLLLELGMAPTARQLLDFPNGLHFRQIKLSTFEGEDIHSIAELVAACSGTLECLHVGFCKNDERAPGPPIDLSKATKLKEVVFSCYSLRVGWVTSTLETITPKHRNLQGISVRIPYILASIASAAEHGVRWSDLDLLLVQFYYSRSIRVRILYPRSQTQVRLVGASTSRGKDWVAYFFPELTRRGIIDVVEEPGGFL